MSAVSRSGASSSVGSAATTRRGHGGQQERRRGAHGLQPADARRHAARGPCAPGTHRAAAAGRSLRCAAPGHPAAIIGQMARRARTRCDRGRARVDRSWTSQAAGGRKSWTRPLARTAGPTYRSYQPGGAIETEPERLVRQSLGSRAKVQPGPFVSRHSRSLTQRRGRRLCQPSWHAGPRRCGCEAGRQAGPPAQEADRDGHHRLSLVRRGRRAPARRARDSEPAFTCPGCATSVALVEERRGGARTGGLTGRGGGRLDERRGPRQGLGHEALVAGLDDAVDEPQALVEGQERRLHGVRREPLHLVEPDAEGLARAPRTRRSGSRRS